MHRKWQMFRTRLGKETILSFWMNTFGKEKLQKKRENKSRASYPNPKDHNILSLAFSLPSICVKWDLIQLLHVDDFLEHLRRVSEKLRNREIKRLGGVK